MQNRATTATTHQCVLLFLNKLNYFYKEKEKKKQTAA